MGLSVTHPAIFNVLRQDFGAVAAAVAKLNPHAEGAENVAASMSRTADGLERDARSPDFIRASAGTYGYVIHAFMQSPRTLVLLATISPALMVPELVEHPEDQA